MTMVGHTLVWYGAMPDWTKNIEGSADAERTMTEHIEKVVGRYRGKIKTWHVVNEPIDEANGNTPGLRPNIWLSNLGDKYIDWRSASRIASIRPPSSLSTNTISNVSTASRRRSARFFAGSFTICSTAACRCTASACRATSAVNIEIDRDGLYDFVAELHALGLAVRVTELDVIDKELPGPIAVRDAIVADARQRFPRCRYSPPPGPNASPPGALPTVTPGCRPGTSAATAYANRPLPLDANYQRKPLWDVIDYYCNK